MAIFFPCNTFQSTAAANDGLALRTPAAPCRATGPLVREWGRDEYGRLAFRWRQAEVGAKQSRHNLSVVGGA